MVNEYGDLTPYMETDGGEEEGEGAVVLMSGGIDSAVCMGIACQSHDWVIPVHFNYGQQTFDLEKRMAARQAHNFHKLYDSKVYTLQVIDYRQVFSHFAQGVANPDKDFDHLNEEDGRSSGYVPVRNLHLIATGAAIADVEGATHVYHGAQGGDAADYPDCRPEFMHKAAGAIGKSVPDSQELNLRTPLIHQSKVEVLEMGDEVGVEWQATYSCYRETEWRDPEPCGECPACLERTEAFEEAGLEDPYD